ncbi:hypothetical protein L9F63_027213, partial [Diploptera punctata]
MSLVGKKSSRYLERKLLPMKMRPATTSRVSSKVREPLDKRRPSSASLDDSEAIVGDQCVSPSALTSGKVVCGNLIMALRSRRKRTNAWTDDKNTNQEPRGQTDFESPKESMLEEKEDKAEDKTETVSEDIKSTTTDVLEESRKWRQSYNEYRFENNHSIICRNKLDTILSLRKIT